VLPPGERPVLEWDPSTPFPEVDPLVDQGNPLFGMLKDNPKEDQLKRYMNRGAAAAAGAFASTVLCTPFDVIKVRLQTGQAGKMPSKAFGRGNLEPPPPGGAFGRRKFSQPSTYTVVSRRFAKDLQATLATFRTVAGQEGAGGLWRGLGVSVGYVIPTSILHFVLYEALMGTVKDREGVGAAAPALSGGLARAVAVSSFAPLEMVRMNVMAGGRGVQGAGGRNVPHGYPKPPHVGARNWLEAARMVWANHGVGGFWTGLRATLARDVPYSAAYWLTYENVRGVIADAKKSRQGAWGEEGSAGPEGGTVRSESGVALFENFAAGGFSATVACILTNPVDVVKTRHQVQVADKGMCQAGQGDPLRTWKVRCQKCHCMADSRQGVWDTLTGIAKKEGPKVLWTGLGVRIAKAFPANAIMMMTFEATKEHLDSRV